MHTNSTPNYNLPQFVSGDKPTWLGDANGAFLAIDTAIAGVNTVAASADAKADLATTAAQTASGVATDAASAAAAASADAASAITTAGNAATAAQSASTAATAAQSTADSAATAATAAQSTADSAATAATAAQSTADSAATTASAVDTKVGDLTDLVTTDKTSIVNAINEVATSGGGTSGSVTVTADGVKSYSALYNELYALLDASKITSKTTLENSLGGGYVLVTKATSIEFSRCMFEGTQFTITDIKLRTTGSTHVNAIASTGGFTPTDASATVPTSGTTFTVRY